MEATGKAAVRELFWARLEAAGLRKPKACKVDADFDAMKRRLVDYLAYMSPIGLETLADQALQVAGGKGRDECPTEILLRNMAEALEKRPVEEAPIIRSWLASIEGPRALAAGEAVEMLRALRKLRRPLMIHDRKEISQEAAENRRWRAVIGERQAAGIDRAEDRQWLAAYDADLRFVQGIVDQAARDRAAKEVAA